MKLLNCLHKSCENVKLVYQSIVIFAKKLVLFITIMFDDNLRLCQLQFLL